MPAPRKISEQAAVDVVRTWLAWKADPQPDRRLDELMSQFGVGVQTAYDYLPAFVIRASASQRRRFLELGWPEAEPTDLQSQLDRAQAELERMRTAMRAAVQVLTDALDDRPGPVV